MCLARKQNKVAHIFILRMLLLDQDELTMHTILRKNYDFYDNNNYIKVTSAVNLKLPQLLWQLCVGVVGHGKWSDNHDSWIMINRPIININLFGQDWLKAQAWSVSEEPNVFS